jgi:hypothetical protein
MRELKKAMITTKNKPKIIKSMLQKCLEELQESIGSKITESSSTKVSITNTRSDRNISLPARFLD